jgi:cell division protein FtsN
MKADVSPDFEDLRYYKHYYSYGESEEKGLSLKSVPVLRRATTRRKGAFGRRFLGTLSVFLALILGTGGFLWYRGDIHPPVRDPAKTVANKAPLPVTERIQPVKQAVAEPQAGHLVKGPDPEKKLPPEKAVPASLAPGLASISRAATGAPPGRPEIKQATVPYPYSLYLGSLKTLEMAKRGAAEYEKEGLSPYWVKVNFTEKGEWYRIFVGQFREREDAEAFAQERGLQEGKVFKTEYANLIGEYSRDSAAEDTKRKLTDLACAPYTIRGGDGKVRLFVGAYVTREAAEAFQTDLRSSGVESRVVKR